MLGLTLALFSIQLNPNKSNSPLFLPPRTCSSLRMIEAYRQRLPGSLSCLSGASGENCFGNLDAAAAPTRGRGLISIRRMVPERRLYCTHFGQAFPLISPSERMEMLQFNSFSDIAFARLSHVRTPSRLRIGPPTGTPRRTSD